MLLRIVKAIVTTTTIQVADTMPYDWTSLGVTIEFPRLPSREIPRRMARARESLLLLFSPSQPENSTCETSEQLT